MEARCVRPLLGLATVWMLMLASPSLAQQRHQAHVAQSENFIVFAASPQVAARASQAAESFRRDLAVYWLGQELPPWQERCPIQVVAAPNLEASGETRFIYQGNVATKWSMTVNGTEQRILDSVLPHEITHTVFATHFARYGQYVPRWADEGACTTVEHEAEKAKHRHYLQTYLRTGRGIPFNTMFRLKDYPADILPLYAQGHSVVQFLLDQAGPRKFVNFVERGMVSNGNWETAVRETYEYQTLGELQLMWNKWLHDGSPKDLIAYAPLMAREAVPATLASNVTPDKLGNSPWSPSQTEQAQTDQAGPVAASLIASNEDPLRGLEQASFASGPSWYRDKFREVSRLQSSASASNLTTGKSIEEPSKYPLQSYNPSNRASARPQPSQGPSVQVLDWGSNQPVAGVAPNAILR
jgi:hypothetical protein